MQDSRSEKKQRCLHSGGQVASLLKKLGDQVHRIARLEPVAQQLLPECQGFGTEA